MKALRITTLLLLGAAALTAGCTVDPFCLDCVDGSVEDTGPEDTGPFDGDIDGGDADADGDGDGDADADAEGCIEELCNGEDDDCDGEVDEDFDLMSNPRHCGRCNNPCELAHAFNACDEGECLIDGCDVCFHDVDGVSTNGCEYACCETESPTVEGSCESGDCCDGVDNDCDGETDEDHDTSNDPLNCGGCSAGCVEGEPCPFRCDYILGIGACVDGVCELSGCVEGHYDVNGDPDDGCEYACTPNPDTGGVEQCNSRDDDCDGEVDESFDGMGDVCGSDEGACETGVLSCDRGAEVCEGEVSPTEDLCDGLDNDCDGETDEDDSRLGGGCSTNMGECVRGTYGCLDGSLVCQGGVDPTVETCNGLDDNCNGVVDDGIADEGSCGTDEGECTAGTRVCLGGRFVCDGSMGPRLEDCNGLDDDCDGEVDEELVRDCSNECGVGEESCADGDWVGCTARVAQPEVCDGADNDCDGSIDEADEGGPLTRSCTEGSCSGVEICLDADTWSSCSVSPRAEECDGEDNDCDGTIDEDVVESCTDDCGPGERTCVVGGVGTWGECVNREPSAEVCDGIDNDCDGDVDEAADGSLLTRDCSFLECSGEETCTAPFTWTGCTASASVEVCDGEDNDCDGEVDENLLRSCGTLCGPGEESCTDGAWGGCTAREPTGEICDGIDNDCNGTADDGLTRACSTVCGDGLESCTGPDTWGGCTAPEPEAEVCDGADNDCDGEIDEDVDLATDPTNCGSCGRDCHSLIPNAAVRCEEGDCVLVACAAGFWDLDPDEPGCEYPCTVTGGESCDGIDNDCNGVVDDWTPPADYCGFYGVCSGVVVDCRDPDGAGAEPVQPICDYGVDYQADETWCDGLDNDCDGTADEGYDVGLAYPCDNGLLGRCFTAGHWECGDDLLSRECLLDEVPLEPADELCNGIDDDCDGAVDDAIALADLDLVQVVADVDLDGDSTVGVGTDEEAHEVWMFAFEASHPDASDTEAGEDWSYACSNTGVVPWAAVSWRDAQAACCGLNDHDADGAVTGGCAYQLAEGSSEDLWIPRGWALCGAPAWEVACQSGDHPTNPRLVGAPFLYTYESDVYDASACNGFDYDSDPAAGGNQSFALDTGALASCAGGFAAWEDDLFDMSGNLHEWTSTGWYVCECDTGGGCLSSCVCDRDCDDCRCDSDYLIRGRGSRCQQGCACDPDCNTFYEYRGGSYENAAPGLTCQFDFNVGADRSDDPDGATEPDPGLVLDSLGFRCCYYPPL